MKLPTRLRLTLWYAALFAATMLALGAFLIVQLRSALGREVDEEAVLASYAILQAIADDSDPNEADLAEDIAEAAEDFQEAALTALHSTEEPAAQVVDDRGRVLAGYGVGAGSPPLVGPDVQMAALAGRPSTVPALLGESQPYRVHATAFQLGPSRRVLLVGVSLGEVENHVAKVTTLLLTAGPAALLATGLVAYWLAARAFRPLGRMTAVARSISSSRLHERVAVPPVHDEMQELAVTLNAMLDRVEEGARQQRQLIGDASHELRTPLAVMRAELDVSLRSADLEPDARDVLASTREEVERMSRIVENLLVLATVDEGRLELLTTAVDLQQLGEAAAAPLRPLAEVKQVSLVTTGEPALAQADPQRITLALTNLIDNAIRFSPAGGTVRIESWRHDGEVGVTVSDSGPGVPAEHQAHLFDRFYQVDGARSRDNGGSGLGLAICREVALAHGGRVSVDSGPGAGSAFSLALPEWRDLTQEH